MVSIYTWYLSQGFYSCTKHHDQEANWAGKGLFSLHFHIAVHHQGSQKWNSSRSESRSWCRGHGGMFLFALLLLACSACFLIEPKTTSSGMTPSTVGPPPLITNWENAPQLGIFSTEAPFSVITPACVKLTHKPSQYKSQAWFRKGRREHEGGKAAIRQKNKSMKMP